MDPSRLRIFSSKPPPVASLTPHCAVPRPGLESLSAQADSDRAGCWNCAELLKILQSCSTVEHEQLWHFVLQELPEEWGIPRNTPQPR